LTLVRTGVWLFPDAPAPRFVSALAAAEQAGLDEVWVGDEGPARDPFGLLAAAATITARIRLAVGVTNPYLRHPVLTATAAATVHELSGARMVLGLGAGGRMALEPLGVRPTRPLADCRDALRLVRAALTATPTTGYDPPVHALTAPDLPVFVGARGERFNRWASSAADGVFVAGIAPSIVPTVVGWARSVRPVEVAVYVSACLADDELEEVRPRMIHAFSDAPEALRARAGLDAAAVNAAALALNAGDDEPARSLMVDGVVDLVLARPADVVATCTGLARDLRPDSIGLALVGGDPLAQVERAAATMHAVKAALA
jgi:5,10-methylenetetrahydromethanopterin reductase